MGLCQHRCISVQLSGSQICSRYVISVSRHQRRMPPTRIRTSMFAENVIGKLCLLLLTASVVLDETELAKANTGDCHLFFHAYLCMEPSRLALPRGGITCTVAIVLCPCSRGGVCCTGACLDAYEPACGCRPNTTLQEAYAQELPRDQPERFW